MVRIDRRMPIKLIAREMGVSETRINQHIRALKDIFDAESLNELVEAYRASQLDLTADMDGVSDALSALGFSPADAAQEQRAFLAERWSQFDDRGERADPAVWKSSYGLPSLPAQMEGAGALWFRMIAILSIFAAVLMVTMLASGAGNLIDQAVVQTSAGTMVE